MMSTPNTTLSRHFTIHELAEGVFAAVATGGGAAISNSGIIDLGNLTVIYDTFLTPQAARDLLAAARYLTGREPEIIINSHYHNDHIWGNQVFSPQAHIISTTETYHLIQTEGKTNSNGRVAIRPGNCRNSGSSMLTQKAITTEMKRSFGWDITKDLSRTCPALLSACRI